MPDYIPSPRQWVRDQVELYERSGGAEGTTLRDTGLPVIIVTHTGNKTGAIRKTPLMRVKGRSRRFPDDLAVLVEKFNSGRPVGQHAQRGPRPPCLVCEG